MKAALRIGLMAWYLVASTGIYLHFHYCGGELSNVGLFGACTHSHNCCDPADDDTGCCQTEDLYLSLDDEHRVLPGLALPVFELASQPAPAIHPPQDLTAPHGHLIFQDRAPPEPLYALYSQRVTYG